MGTKILGGNEAVTGDVAMILTDHKYIHKGQAFTVSLATGNLTPTSSEKIRFKTPIAADGYVHARPISISSTTNLIKVEFYEAATFSNNGTTQTSYNRNREISTTTANTVVGKAATTSDDGTLLFTFIAGSGGSVQSRAGGSLPGDSDEWVLKDDTEYCIVITNIGSSTDTVGYISLFWYEEESSGA